MTERVSDEWLRRLVAFDGETGDRGVLAIELLAAREVVEAARVLLKALDPRDYLSEADDLDDALAVYDVGG